MRGTCIGKTVREGLAILGLTPEQAGIDLPKSKLPPKRNDLADAFAVLWEKLGPPIPLVREYRFCPTRRFRFDCAWPEQKVAVEIEGGLWVTSRHRTGLGYHRDMQKYNLATQLGWKLLRFAANDLELSPVQTVEIVAKLLL